MDDITRPEIKDRRLWQRIGMLTAGLGFVIQLLGAKPAYFGIRDSEPVGVVQMGVFTIGLLLMCLGGYWAIDALWKQRERSILAELGVRTMSTGFIFAMVSALADLFGLGTRPFPGQTFFGHWQARGVMIGELAIIIGLLMMVPYPGTQSNPPTKYDT